MDKSLVFISHAARDKHYAELLGDYIARTIEDTKSFVASAPESIPSGEDGFREILHSLCGADALVIVYSGNSRSSLWLGFELGHFWRKHNGKNIHCVFDPTIELASPLNERQAKDFTDIASMAVFFRGLAGDLGRNYDADENGVTQLVEAAPKVEAFAKWKSLLQNGQWSKRELSGRHGSKTVWSSVEEPTYTIEDTYEVANKNFSEPWTTGFPDPHTESRWVDLKISGETIEQLLFVSLDGGRYFVPVPRRIVSENLEESLERGFYYDRTSLQVLLGHVIGQFHISDSLEEFARSRSIKIN